MHRDGEAADTLPGLGQAQRRLFEGLAFSGVAGPGRHPAQCGRNLGGAYSGGGEGGEAAGRGGHLPVEEVEHHGATDRRPHGGIGQGGVQGPVGQDKLLNRHQVVRQDAEHITASRTSGFENGGGVTLQRGVH